MTLWLIFISQVHVGEYGVHWNFFFTLAAVAILSSMINISPEYCGFFGCLILIGICAEFVISTPFLSNCVNNYLGNVSLVYVYQSAIHACEKCSQTNCQNVLHVAFIFIICLLKKRLGVFFPHVLKQSLCSFYASVYQVALLCGLNDYLLSDQRGTNIVSLNKEGIFSLFGIVISIFY